MRQQHILLSRRKALRAGVMVAGLGLLSACGQRDGDGPPRMRFIYPDWQGARIQDSPVQVQVRVENYLTVTEQYRPGRPPLRAVFFINTPVDAVADGQPVPDDPQRFVPAVESADTFINQSLDLPAGVHTITAVMVDGQGNKAAEPPPVSLTVLVQPGGLSVR